MIMTEDDPHLKQAYRLGSQQDTKRLYADWADSYDDTMQSHDYRTPVRCAEALKKYLTDRMAPICDIGCGTGISGLALYDAGFRVIDGTDISAEMLVRAGSHKDVYRQLREVSLEEPFDFAAGEYAAITAMGVIADKHAPPETISELLNRLDHGGLLVFSLNNHTLENPDYLAECRKVVERGDAELLEEEMGQHIVRLGMTSKIMVMRKR